MTLRSRVSLAAGLAVLLSVIAVSIAVYAVVAGMLYAQVDASLGHYGSAAAPPQPSATHGTSTQAEVWRQVVDRNGDIVAGGTRRLPVTGDVLAVARGERDQAFFDADVDGASVRVYAAATDQGALEVARSLEEVHQTLRQLVFALTVISVAALGLAAGIGRLVAAAATAPVRRVAEAADQVARTGELSQHLTIPSGDDLGRLVASFNTMLDALSESLSRQRQLVADASHELRTPLATVRTNVEVLARADELPADERTMLIRDTVAQISELTRLVDDLVELARGDAQEEPFTLIDLIEITRDTVDAAAKNYPSISWRVEGSPTLVRGAAGRVARAVSNLIDNAAKWSPPGGEVEVIVDEGGVIVKDHGPGIDPDDLPHIFDRFYRSPAARSMPGSGLGLAIVKQVADSHDASLTAANAPDGGAAFVLRFPVIDKSTGTSSLENLQPFSSGS